MDSVNSLLVRHNSSSHIQNKIAQHRIPKLLMITVD